MGWGGDYIVTLLQEGVLGEFAGEANLRVDEKFPLRTCLNWATMAALLHLVDAQCTYVMPHRYVDAYVYAHV